MLKVKVLRTSLVWTLPAGADYWTKTPACSSPALLNVYLMCIFKCIFIQKPTCGPAIRPCSEKTGVFFLVCLRGTVTFFLVGTAKVEENACLTHCIIRQLHFHLANRLGTSSGNHSLTKYSSLGGQLSLLRMNLSMFTPVFKVRSDMSNIFDAVPLYTFPSEISPLYC